MTCAAHWWQNLQMVEGHEVWYITCRGCGRKTERTVVGNSLVGQQARLRCNACGHRGADILRVWTVGKAPVSAPGTSS